MHVSWRRILAGAGNKIDGRDMVPFLFVDELETTFRFVSGLKRVVFLWRGLQYSDWQKSSEIFLSKVKAKLGAEKSYSHLKITGRRDSE